MADESFETDLVFQTRVNRDDGNDNTVERQRSAGRKKSTVHGDDASCCICLCTLVHTIEEFTENSAAKLADIVL